VVHLACRVDLSRLDSGALQMVSEPTFAATGACGSGAGHGFHCACRLCGVHGVAHVLALGAQSRVLRGNVPGYRLPDCQALLMPYKRFVMLLNQDHVNTTHICTTPTLGVGAETCLPSRSTKKCSTPTLGVNTKTC
jgi:hypothetical protein